MNRQKGYAIIIGTVLIARGLLGFLLRSLPGDLSANLNHNFVHTIIGVFFLWVGLYAKPSAARGWNKFLGYVYTTIALFGIINVQLLAQSLGQNSVTDNVFNALVAIASLLVGYNADRPRRGAQ